MKKQIASLEKQLAEMEGSLRAVTDRLSATNMGIDRQGIQPRAINEFHLVDSCVGTAKIADGAVTIAKLGPMIPYVLAKSTTVVTKSIAGEQTFATIVIPGGTLGTGGTIIRVSCVYNRTSGTGTGNIYFRYNSQALGTGTASNTNGRMPCCYFWANGATNSIKGIMGNLGGVAGDKSELNTQIVDSTIDQNLTLSLIIGTGGDNWNLENYIVEVV